MKLDHIDKKLKRKYRIQIKVIECKWKMLEWRKTIQHIWIRSNIATFDKTLKLCFENIPVFIDQGQC